jgi:hypothetical protein
MCEDEYIECERAAYTDFDNESVLEKTEKDF